MTSEEQLRSLVESVPDFAIFMLDPAGRVATWNAGAQRIKGYEAGDIIGKHFSIFYSAEEVASGKCDRELEVASREGRFEEEGWRLRKGGSRFWANVVTSPMRDEAGALVGFARVTRELTEKRRAEEERAARLSAERASFAKDEFLAMLGHELRNPLAPILTALQLMKLRPKYQNSKEVQVIERQVSHIRRLVDDLLDVSRITRGKIALKKHRVDLRDVLAKALEVANPFLEQARHHFEFNLPDRALPLNADEARLTQVFGNLLVNAARYTEPGGHICIEVDVEGGDVVVQVRDDGIGIDAELLPRIFDLFVQGRPHRDKVTAGLGMGLTLVRSLVTMHGGSVEARSEGEGKGSTFVVKLPLAEREAASNRVRTQETTFPRAARPARILIVDDNEDGATLLADLLAACGHEVRTAKDAASALAVVGSYQPEVALLDIGLPVMDGYALAQHLRALLGPKTPRLIALTGYGQRDDRERARRAGFDEHLVKPIDADRLLQTIVA